MKLVHNAMKHISWCGCSSASIVLHVRFGFDYDRHTFLNLHDCVDNSCMVWLAIALPRTLILYIHSTRRRGVHSSLSLQPQLCTTGNRNAPDLCHDSRYSQLSRLYRKYHAIVEPMYFMPQDNILSVCVKRMHSFCTSIIHVHVGIWLLFTIVLRVTILDRIVHVGVTLLGKPLGEKGH